MTPAHAKSRGEPDAGPGPQTGASPGASPGASTGVSTAAAATLKPALATPVREISSQRAGRLALAGLLVNLVLGAVKLVAGILGNSYALIADALESMVDVAGSVVIWGGLRYGARPADENHPFGHGKAESLAAMAVGVLVAFAGIGIGAKAFHEISAPKSAPAAWTLIVLLLVVAAKETLFRAGRRLGSSVESSAVRADAWHHRSDAITSLAAFVGISVAVLGGPGYESADGWAALFAAGIICWNGWSIAKAPLRELMDEQPNSLPPRITAIALAVPGVLEVEKIRVLRFGMKVAIDLHVQVEPTLSVREGHAIGGRVKSEIRVAMPEATSVLVHLEPYEGPRGQ